jgi:tripartite-type tricarboxylate transporter receptor subunit TctC
LALAFGSMASRAAHAQGQWPTRAVTMVVPWAAGGSNDIVARLLSPGLQKAFGKSFVVENRAGGGAVGKGQVARVRPDGQTLLISSASNHVFNHFVVPDQGYDPREALSGICMMVDLPNVLAVHRSLGVSDVPGLLAKIRATPGGMSYASTGIGSSNHLAGELFRLLAKVELNHIPYRGTALALQDVVTGRVTMNFSSPPPAVPLAKEGRLRALAVTGNHRLPPLPEVPTLSEAGLPGIVILGWHGIFAPAGTPESEMSRLEAAANKAIRDPRFARSLERDGLEVAAEQPRADFAKAIREEYEFWGAKVRELDLKAE